MKLPVRIIPLVVFTLLTGCSSNPSSDDTGDTSDNNTTPSEQSRTITVVSWGGAYEKSQVEAYHKPWMSSTGNEIDSVSYNGGLEKIQSQVASGNVTWDVVDVELPEAKSACDQGLLETIDAESLPQSPSGTAARADFIDGTLSPCGVASIIWSTVVAFDTGIPGNTPTSIVDFFDTASFPGKRGVRKNPSVILEMALMADGVPANSVYSELGSAAGIDQAFAKLDQIKDEIVWWETGAESMDLLADGDVVMTTAYNGRVFNESATNNNSYGTLWDAQVWDIDLWVIPKGTPNKDLALDFIHFSTATEQLAKQASYIAYAPARLSSLALVGNHYELGIDMKPHLPTTPQNFQRALQSDGEFWNNNQQSLNERFDSWLAQ